MMYEGSVVVGKKLIEGEIRTNAKETKGVGKAIIDGAGLLCFLFGSLILLGIVFVTIGGIFIFISPNKLFQFKRVKRDEDNSRRRYMNLRPKDIVVVSGTGRTKDWDKDLRGTVLKVDEKSNSVFVIWYGTSVEDETTLILNLSKRKSP